MSSLPICLCSIFLAIEPTSGGVYFAASSSALNPRTTFPADLDEYPQLFFASATNLHRGGDDALALGDKGGLLLLTSPWGCL